MAKPWRSNLIRARRNSIQEILREIEAADDLDLWEEADGKLTDAILVYRRAKQTPETFTFSDGVTRDLTEMVYSHAREHVFPELDADDEFPAWMERGESKT